MSKYLWEAVQKQIKENKRIPLKIMDNLCTIYELNKFSEVDVSKRFKNEFASYIRHKVTVLEEVGKIEEKKYEEIENEMLFILGKLDFLRGINKKTIMEKFILEKIFQEKDMSFLTENEKKYIVRGYYKISKTLDNTSVFLEVLKNFFPYSYIYNYKETNEILIYLSVEKNEINLKKIQLIIDIFLDITILTRLFWRYHFGIIGNEETMKLNQIEIF